MSEYLDIRTIDDWKAWYMLENEQEKYRPSFAPEVSIGRRSDYVIVTRHAGATGIFSRRVQCLLVAINGWPLEEWHSNRPPGFLNYEPLRRQYLKKLGVIK